MENEISLYSHEMVVNFFQSPGRCQRDLQPACDGRCCASSSTLEPAEGQPGRCSWAVCSTWAAANHCPWLAQRLCSAWGSLFGVEAINASHRIDLNSFPFPPMSVLLCVQSVRRVTLNGALLCSAPNLHSELFAFDAVVFYTFSKGGFVPTC